MDSLLASYASSDEEDDHQQGGQSLPSKGEAVSLSSSKTSSLFSYLPQPKSTSLLSSLPQPKQQTSHIPITPTENSVTLEEDEEEKESKKPSFNSKRSSSIFTSLPQPKSKTLDQPLSTVSSSETTAKKKVVQFRPPSMSSNHLIDEDEDEEEEKERPKRKQSEYLNQSSSVKSFLSSIPAPKKSASLGAIPSALGSGRRSIIETEPSSSTTSSLGANSVSGNNQYVTNDAAYESGSDQNATTCANYQASTVNYANYEVGESQSIVDCGSYGYGVDPSTQNTDNSSYVNYDNYNGYGDYGSASMVQGSMGAAQSGVGFPGRRRKNEIPTEIVEVKQDELIKNRPTEDNAKLTGRAFGPSYAPVSTKGKPTKLHKRKHQIGSLFFEMKQKEMELAERRARGFQTKAQTQGKYGW